MKILKTKIKEEDYTLEIECEKEFPEQINIQLFKLEKIISANGEPEKARLINLVGHLYSFYFNPENLVTPYFGLGDLTTNNEFLHLSSKETTILDSLLKVRILDILW
ncbi:hypothetical protein ACE5IS_19460, partial [Leptospira wolffii]